MKVHAYQLPDVGEGLAEAEILSWRVAPGQRVARDQTIAEIQTDKSIVEIPAPVDGVLRRHGAAEGEVLAVGELLAEFELDDAPGDDWAAAPDAGLQIDPDVDAPTPAVAADRGRGRVRASPSTRRYAHAHGIDLAAVEATGPGGRVTRADVERAETSAGPASGEPEKSGPAQGPASPRSGPVMSREARADETETLRGMRRQVARTMTAALEVPTIYDWREVDAGELLRTRDVLRAQVADGPRVTLLPLVVKAVVAALEQHRRFNATFDAVEETVTRHGACHVGVATATPEGLVVPVVHDADQRGLAELADEIARLAGAARDRRIAVEETRGGTITVSNYGSYGTRHGTPIIRPPEAAIIGVGRVHDAVVASADGAVVRPVLPFVVGTDHRLNDGDHLAAFCDTLGAYLAEPRLLLAATR